MIALEHIGTGRQKDVFSDGEVVVAQYKERFSPMEAKSVYYLNRLTRALIPDSSIHISLAGTDTDGTYQESAYVPQDEAHRIVHQSRIRGEVTEEAAINAFRVLHDREHSPAYTELTEKARGAGLFFDTSLINFIQKDDGSMVYTDFGPAFVGLKDSKGNPTSDVHWNFDEVLVRNAISQLRDETRRAEAQSSLDRILALAKEYEQAYTK